MDGRETAPAPTFLEFFSGIGLVRAALESEGARCVFANDVDAGKCALYRSNFRSSDLQERSIAELSSCNVPTADFATASFPCIDLTMCGLRRGFAGEHSSTVWHFTRLIGELRDEARAPRLLMLENVPGMLGPSMLEQTSGLLRRLCDLGYSIDVLLVDAARFLPQSRRRVFVIAVDRRIDGPWVPPAAALRHAARGKVVRRCVDRLGHLPWRFLDLPRLPTRAVRLADLLVDPPEDHRSWLPPARVARFLSRLERHPRDHAKMLEDLRARPGTDYLSATEHGRCRQASGTSVYLRQGTASCLMRPRGGNSRQWVIRLRGGTIRVRTLNGLEHARLQGVCHPDRFPWFRLPPGELLRKRAFGDAVCVPVVSWIYRHGLAGIVGGEDPRRTACRLARVTRRSTAEALLARNDGVVRRALIAIRRAAPTARLADAPRA